MRSADDDSDDAVLVAAIARGDEAAFSALYRRYLPLVTRWCLRETGDRELAADLTAEVFAGALQSSRRFQRERGTVAAWLLGIAANKLRESRRRGRVEDSARRRLGIDPVGLADADLERVDELAGHDLDGLLDGLSEDQREALLLRVVAKRSYAEIATALRCSESVVRQRVSRGLKTLKSRLEGP